MKRMALNTSILIRHKQQKVAVDLLNGDCNNAWERISEWSYGDHTNSLKKRTV